MLLGEVINSKVNRCIKVFKGINNVDFVGVEYNINEGDFLLSIGVIKKKGY